MSFNLLNPVPRLGDPYQTITPGGEGLPFYNNTGGTISRGQIAAIDVRATTSHFQNLISTGANASAAKYDLVVALADVASGNSSTRFAPLGEVPALASSGVAKGDLLMPGTANSTGGNVLIAASTVSGSPTPCAIWASNSTSNASDPDTVIFKGTGRFGLGAVAGAIW